MENQRLFLWSMLAIVLFFMMQAWQKDYGPKPVQQTVEQTSGISETAPVDLNVPGVDTTNSEIPAVQATSNTQQQTVVTPKKGETITVNTDVYKLELSTQGASIVGLTLPNMPKDKKNPDVPVVLFANTPEETYVLNSGLRASGVAVEPTHQEIWNKSASVYELGDKDNIQVPFTWVSPEGLEISKTYTFSRNSHVIKVDYQVNNKTAQNISVRPYAQIQRRHPPLERSMFDVDSFSNKGPAWFNSEKYEKISPKDLVKEPIKQEITDGWLAAIEHHFLTAIVPNAGEVNTFQVTAKGPNDYSLTTAAPSASVAAGTIANFSQNYFAGPKNQKELAALSPRLDLTTDYGVFSIISKPLFSLLSFVHGIIGNWGWAIIVVTLLIKAVFYPLTAKSARSMAAMKKLQPRMKLLQERYKDDKQKLSQATMDMYKKEKINPAAGCLPVLIQFPFFLGFYWLLIESVELRQVPWMMWIQDLSSKDPLFILPVLYGITMYLQQKVQPMSGGNPEMQKVMKFMPIAMVGLFSFFPAGLVLYWITNSAVTVIQQWYINKQLAKSS